MTTQPTDHWSYPNADDSCVSAARQSPEAHVLLHVGNAIVERLETIALALMDDGIR